jgi:hypothetical protein
MKPFAIYFKFKKKQCRNNIPTTRRHGQLGTMTVPSYNILARETNMEVKIQNPDSQANSKLLRRGIARETRCSR